MSWVDKSNFIRFFYTRRFWGDCLNLLFDNSLGAPFWKRFILLKRLYAITFATENIPHSQQKILLFVHVILRAPRSSDGVIIEAGCFKGIS
jgi:hypothetical protein